MAEAEIDYPKDESDDEFLPARPRKASPKKRRSELAVAQVPIPPSARSSRSTPYVFISTRLKKRPLVVDSSVPSNPKKRVKMDKYGPPRRKAPKALGDRTVECAPAAETVVPKPTAGSRTIVPVGSSLAAKGMSGPVPGSSLTSAQDSGQKSLHAAKRVTGHSQLELSKSTPSVYSSVPASSTATTRAEGASTDHPSPGANALLIDGLRSELKKERNAKAELKKQLDEAQRSNSVLSLRMEGLKASKSDRRAAEMRAEISNLRKELAEEREEKARREQEKVRREQDNQLNINHLFQDIMTLKEELKRSQASSADGDRNLSEVSHTTGMMTGSALSQVPPSPSKELQPPRGPRASSYGTGYTATGSMPNSTYHQAPRVFHSYFYDNDTFLRITSISGRSFFQHGLSEDEGLAEASLTLPLAISTAKGHMLSKQHSTGDDAMMAPITTILIETLALFIKVTTIHIRPIPIPEITSRKQCHQRR